MQVLLFIIGAGKMGKDLKGKELGDGLSQKKDGRYCARFTDRFGRRPEYKSKSLSECRKWLKEQKAMDTLEQNVVDDGITLDQYFLTWLDIHKYGIIKDNTKAGYIVHYKKHISPIFGKKKVSEIKKIQIKALYNNEHRQGLAYETRNRTRKMLQDMLERALEDGLVRANEAKGLKVIRDEEKEPRVLTSDEQRDIMRAVSGTFYWNLLETILGSGLRPGEAYALEEKDCDFDKRIIKVTKTLIYQKWEHAGDTQKTFHIDGPKTYTSVREIPMSDLTYQALQRQIIQKKIIAKRQHTGNIVIPEGMENLLFTTKFNTPICTQNVIDDLKKRIDALNIMRDDMEQIEPVHVHTFRHTFATRCIEAGMQPKTLQKILGHATLQMTMDLYVHVTDDRKHEEIGLLDEAVNKIMKDDNDKIIQFVQVS